MSHLIFACLSLKVDENGKNWPEEMARFSQTNLNQIWGWFKLCSEKNRKVRKMNSSKIVLMYAVTSTVFNNV